MTGRLRVAFVDDEQHILRALRRSLGELGEIWELTFCTSGREALDLMAIEPFDVLVTDMRMPAMDGAEFLNVVRRNYPGTVRIVLSGYAEREAVLRTVGPSHGYLAKPCNIAALQQAISRQIGLRRLLNDPDLRRLLLGIANLPSMPETCLKLEMEMTSATASVRSVADIVGEDIAMAAEVLKLTNSAYFALNGNITTPLQAIRTLGLEVVHSLILRIGLFRQFSGNPAAVPMIEALSLHGLQIARIAEAIALAETTDVATGRNAFCAAMLSSIGCLVLLDARPEDYLAMLPTVGFDHPLHVAEKETFGASHATVGAYLLGSWGFADPIVEAIAYCTWPSASPVRDNLVLTAVHAARALGPQLPFSPTGPRDSLSLDMDYLTTAGLGGKVDSWCGLVVRHSIGRE
jgi:HD-like signal output (HDOD) protein/CheY-like chemotaxis protein